MVFHLQEAGSALQSVQTELNDLKTQHTITTQELEKVASRNKELTTQIDGLRGINTQLRTDNDDLRQRAEVRLLVG
jgi:septal ring factor EnvC (AmiA/AmiB activator)